MGIDLSTLNDAQKSLIDPKDRRGMGKLGITHSEARASAMAKNEREFQKEVLAYLRVNGVRMIINPPMNKRSQLPVGWPDFSFVYLGVPVTWEAKIGKNVLQPDQIKAREALIADGWQYREVRSIFDCQRHLREISESVKLRPLDSFRCKKCNEIGTQSEVDGDCCLSCGGKFSEGKE